MLGLGLSIPQLAARGLRLTDLAAAIRALFAAGEQGVWYDPSDLTTLFQDAAGTIPVTAVEQPVGLILDKSKNGVGTNGAKRVNLLTKTEQFDDAAWTKLRTTVVANGFAGPDGASTADKLVEDATTGSHITAQGAAVTAGAAYTFSFFLRASERVSVLASMSVSFPANSDCVFDASTGVATNVAATSVSMVPVGNGWYRCSVTATANATGTGNMNLYLRSGTSISYTGNGTSGIYIWGADLRVANDGVNLPPYQKITDTWYNTLPGNHAFQSTSTNRPVLSGRYNLLTKTEQFDDAVWMKIGNGAVTVTANTTTAPDGTTTADTINCINGATAIWTQIGSSALAAGTYTFLCSVLKGKSFNLTIDDAVANGIGAYFNGATGVAQTVTLGSGWTLNSSSCVTHPSNSGYWLASITVVRPTTTVNTNISIRPNINDSATYSGACTVGQTLVVWGADLRVANDGFGLPAYQRVNTATDYDATGFPLYLSFNGLNQWMQTNAINFKGTDKMTVFAGVRKLSDASLGCVTSTFSSGAAGGFELLAPRVAPGEKYGFLSAGTLSAVAITSNAAFIAPATNVLTGIGNISGDQAILRANGVQVGSSTDNQGTGNYGNYSLHLGIRPSSAFPFAGRLYQLVARGAQSTEQQITDAETYINSKTKAYA